MKGKSLKLKIVFAMLIFLTLGVFVSVGVLPKQQNKIYAVSTKVELGADKEEFSALFDGNIIFSTEKVLVNTQLDAYGVPNNISGGKEFLGALNGGSLNNRYTFLDIQNGTKNKTVIDNGKFAVLNNVEDGNNIHIQGNNGRQEAIMVSFGAYILDGTTISIADSNGEDSKSAKITDLKVSLSVDGKSKTDIPAIREQMVGGQPYLDFVYLITQDLSGSNEGFYKFTFEYMVNFEDKYTEEFEFYIVNKASYEKTLGANNGYNAKPVLGWSNESQFEKTSKTDGYVRYFAGQSGNGSDTISYPTLTYDYTKYSLSYTHTANQKNTTYKFTPEYKINSGVTEASLKYSITANGKITEDSFYLSDYDSDALVNLVTIMLTEPGTYVATYDYIYSGYNANVAPELDIERDPIYFAIHGLSAYYSKTNFEGARMQYYEIASKSANNVDLFIPNGYEVNSSSMPKDTKIGFAYKLVDETEREGNILKTNSIDSLINLKQNDQYTYLSGNVADIKDPSKISSLTDLATKISNLTYAQTNQGSIWIEGNDIFDTNSFYFYSPTKITVANLINDKGTDVKTDDDSTARDFTNTTSFNTKGYYLAFIKVKPNGITTGNKDYWQIFAFQYTSSSVNINIKTTDGDVISGGAYTNKDVEVAWEKPGVFDRKINPTYYSVLNKTASKEELLESTKHEVEELNVGEKVIDSKPHYYFELGGVDKGTFKKFLIKMENEGDSATYKMFTIDRQDISGIQPYLVAQNTYGNTVYYSYAVDGNNRTVPLSQSITDGYATLYWDEKASDAKIHASYSYTPFVQNGDTARSIDGYDSKEWISTNYQLGTTIENLKLEKADSIYNVGSSCILFNQGIYLIKLWDDAGNTCYYAFIIDRTENYFMVENEPLTNSRSLHGDDVDYSIGDYKVFMLNTVDGSLLEDFVSSATSGDFSNFEDAKNNKYYDGANTNKTAISKYFQNLASEDKNYFTVKNNGVDVYQNRTFEGTKANAGTINYVESSSNAYIRTLYVRSENQTDINKYKFDRTYVTIEISKDNALGTVYYSSSAIDGTVGSAKTLPTSREINCEDGNATSADYVAFVWNIGSGTFEVVKVYYTYYSLKPSTYNDSELYFYGSGEPHEIYNNGWIGEPSLLADGRAYYNFNGTNISREGLYVVTREYKDSANLGHDIQKRDYYFIVDRNGIIDTVQDIGNNIKIILAEEEDTAVYDNFTTLNITPEPFNYPQDNIKDKNYNVYLSTTKLPATLKIPTGKYMDETHTSADYYAGKLNVAVYFVDTDDQIKDLTTQKPVKIYDSLEMGVSANNNYFVVDIYDYLSKYNPALKDRLANKDNGEWLFLSGDYVIRIYDNVVDELTNNHEKYIGLRIAGKEEQGPQIEVNSGFTEADASKLMTNADGYNRQDTSWHYSATASQEFLEVVLPKYDETSTTKAQIDTSYVMVTRIVDGDERIVVNHPYTSIDGKILTETKEYSDVKIVNTNGQISLWLNTLLRDESGNVIKENLSKSITFEIVVRYKLQSDERYKNCFVYYVNGNSRYYYESKYIITIDRNAPNENIKNLNDADPMVEAYNQYFETDNMIENSFHETSSSLYFTKQYAKYYQANKANKGYIYAYQVDASTGFDKTDVKRVGYNLIGDLKAYNLTLPLIDESKYIGGFIDVDDFEGYAGLGLIPNNYYEIVEIDAAGNVTQYVIHYAPSPAKLTIPFIITTGQTEAKHEVVIDEGTDTTEESQLLLFSIANGGEAIAENENFFIIKLSRSGVAEPIKTIYTTAVTDWANLTQILVDEIQTQGVGQYELTISSRKKSATTTLILCGDIRSLDQYKLKQQNANGTFSINLAGANETEVVNGFIFWHFATDIIVKYTNQDGDFVEENYEGVLVDGEPVYRKNGEFVNPIINCLDNTTYSITMLDFTKIPKSFKFNTAGNDPIKIEGDYFVASDGVNNIHYSYSSIRLYFDKTIYSNFEIKSKDASGQYADPFDDYVEETLAGNYNYILVEPIFDEITGKGGLIEIGIFLTGEGENDVLYFTIDSRLSDIVLRDFSGNLKTGVVGIHNNLEINHEDARPNGVAVGDINLYWENPSENHYFDYEYKLHELLEDGTYKDVSNQLIDKTILAINLSNNSTGIFTFEIIVSGKNGLKLGNRLFVFEIRESSSKLYEVRYVEDQNGDNIPDEMKANSSFTLKELNISAVDTLSENVRIPLYVSNKQLEVVLLTENETVTQELVYNENGLTIIKISKPSSYDIFFGILKIDETHDLVNAVSVVLEHNSETGSITNTTDIMSNTSLTIAGEKNDIVRIKAELKNKANEFDKIKNLLYIDTIYNGTLVKSELLTENNVIDGNGQYSFVIRDLAGNVHDFNVKEDREAFQLELYVLREVILLVNNEAPIQNAFYNDTVTLTVYKSTIYTTGSISIEAYRNGELISVQGFTNYEFSEYGSYKIRVKAEYKDTTMEEAVQLEQVVSFTIVNVKEARNSIDLTSLSGCEITKVLNPNGQNKTQQFLQMLQECGDGMNITYKNVIKYAEQLNVTAGKLKFTITYSYADKIYPNRLVDFSFTLNNENPTLECSIEKGDKTTKGFEIRFNPAIIYEQIGDAYIYVNGKVMMTIDENSQNHEQTILMNFKNNGAGDYYIKLVSSSGSVWDSFKVTIKEPLNFWAIIVIIAVVGVVGTVVTTIIVLRRKMRIR